MRRCAAASLGVLLLMATGASGQDLAPDRIRTLVSAEADSALARYRELLSMPNDAHFPEDIGVLTAWVETAFGSRGFETQRLETPGADLLLAGRRAPVGPSGMGASEGLPTVLFYLQADGQPVDRSRWFQADPYGPVLKARGSDGAWREVAWESLPAPDPGRPLAGWDPELRIFARSASDSKGPIAQFLAALDLLRESGTSQPYHIKVVVDFEEEMGSPNLPGAVSRNREALASDMLVILDGPPHISGAPSLKFGARGISRFTLTTYGPRVPVHSGHYGNFAPNPALRLAQILSSMKDREGRVTIPGFYDGVVLSDETRALLDRVPDDEEAIRDRLGIAQPDSVAGSLQEAVQFPSLNVRGLSSGWVGAEARTIVPATATAEVDVRLVLESDPARLMGLIREHIESLGFLVLDREPTEQERMTYPRIATFQWSVSYLAFRTEFDSAPGLWLRDAYRRLYGEEPILIRTSGGSVPISPFVNTLEIPAVSVPTVNPDNNQHSPNENLRLGSFLDGIAVMLTVLSHPVPIN
jgi:acetylornithine deacetylase/succinyl-diaminopimelate desuccinylase-like protein